MNTLLFCFSHFYSSMGSRNVFQHQLQQNGKNESGYNTDFKKEKTDHKLKSIPLEFEIINWEDVFCVNLELSQCHSCPLAEQENKCSGRSGWNVSSETVSKHVKNIYMICDHRVCSLYSINQPEWVCAFNELTANWLLRKSQIVIVPSSPPANFIWVWVGWYVTRVKPA